MTLNPPIRSVSAHTAPPDEHIYRYLNSVSPYVQQFAPIGQNTFERDVVGIDERLKRQQSSSSQEKAYDRIPTWQDLEARLARTGLQARELSGKGQTESQQGRSPKESPLHFEKGQGKSEREPTSNLLLQQDTRDLRSPRINHADRGSQRSAQRPLARPADPPRKPKRPRSTERRIDPEEVVKAQETASKAKADETESGKRRVLRKIRRREKAAILKPKPASPSPTPTLMGAGVSRKRQSRTLNEPHDDYSRGHAVQRRGRRGRHAAPLSAWPTNERSRQYLERGRRLTLQPKHIPGFLSKGKASARLHIPLRQGTSRPRVRQVIDDLDFLAVPRAPLPENQETELQRYPVTTHHSVPGKSSFVADIHPTFLRQDNRRRVAAMDRRLPSPGITGSPSWPSNPTSGSLPSQLDQPRRLAEYTAAKRASHLDPEVRSGRRTDGTYPQDTGSYTWPDQRDRPVVNLVGATRSTTFPSKAAPSDGGVRGIAYGQVVPYVHTRDSGVASTSRSQRMKPIYEVPGRGQEHEFRLLQEDDRLIEPFHFELPPTHEHVSYRPSPGFVGRFTEHIDSLTDRTRNQTVIYPDRLQHDGVSATSRQFDQLATDQFWYDDDGQPFAQSTNGSEAHFWRPLEPYPRPLTPIRHPVDVQQYNTPRYNLQHQLCVSPLDRPDTDPDTRQMYREPDAPASSTDPAHHGRRELGPLWQDGYVDDGYSVVARQSTNQEMDEHPSPGRMFPHTGTYDITGDEWKEHWRTRRD